MRSGRRQRWNHSPARCPCMYPVKTAEVCRLSLSSCIPPPVQTSLILHRHKHDYTAEGEERWTSWMGSCKTGRRLWAGQGSQMVAHSFPQAGTRSRAAVSRLYLQNQSRWPCRVDPATLYSVGYCTQGDAGCNGASAMAPAKASSMPTKMYFCAVLQSCMCVSRALMDSECIHHCALRIGIAR